MKNKFFAENDTIHAEGLALPTDMYETQLNNNVLLIGTPGAGKTQGWVKPNVLQMNSSYVVTDPKGSLIGDVGQALEDSGYRVWSLNLASPGKSSVSYNPFSHIRSEEDVRALAHSIVYSHGERESNDPFWDNSAEILLMALAELVREEEARGGEVASIPCMAEAMDDYFYAARGQVGAANRLVERFEQIRTGLVWDGQKHVQREARPDSPACRLWSQFQAITEVETTMRCILMEAISHLAPFRTKEVAAIISSGDQVSFAALGTTKCALFVVVSDTDRSLDPLVSILYTQMFRELCRLADSALCEDAGHRLPVPVRVILDDFANIGTVKDFDSVIAAVRSRDIWITVVCQSVGQLASKYGKAATTIAECCDTTIYLGSNSLATMRELSERADIPVSEVQTIPVGELYAFVRGRAPVRTARYNVADHPAYPLTAAGSGRGPYEPGRTVARSSRGKGTVAGRGEPSLSALAAGRP